MATKNKFSPEILTKYEGMFRNIDKLQWDIGKSLHEDEIISDGDLEELGVSIGRSPRTLKTYYSVYINFKSQYPEGRPETVPHGVLEELLRVPAAARSKFLAANSSPQKNQATSFVDAHLRSTGKPKSPPRQTTTENVTIAGVRFKLSDDGNTGTVTLFGVSKAQTRQDISGNWVLEYVK